MKSINLTVRPRQSGKTYYLVESALNNEYCSNTPILFIVVNNNMVNHIKDMIISKKYTTIEQYTMHNQIDIITQDDPYMHLDIKKYSSIYIDEYLFFSLKNQARLYDRIVKLDSYNVYIASTPMKMFDEHIFNCVCFIKKYFQKYGDDLYINTFKNLLIKSSPDAEYLYNNFLTDANTIMSYWYDVVKGGYGDYEQFEIERLGKLFNE